MHMYDDYHVEGGRRLDAASIKGLYAEQGRVFTVCVCVCVCVCEVRVVERV